MQPTVVITRPKAQAESFAAELRATHGTQMPVLIAPLMRIAPVTPTEIGDPAHVIFTSVNGVDQAVRLGISQTATAWCVGDQTAAAAARLGFDVKNVKGTSADLIDMVIKARPDGEIVHLRGAHATGQIVENLTQAGLTCHAKVVYAQEDEAPSDALLRALGETGPLIIPVFSPRSAALLTKTMPHRAPLILIAMSESVAAVAAKITKADVITVNFPDKSRMIAATLSAYDALYFPKTP